MVVLWVASMSYFDNRVDIGRLFVPLLLLPVVGPLSNLWASVKDWCFTSVRMLVVVVVGGGGGWIESWIRGCNVDRRTGATLPLMLLQTLRLKHVRGT